MRFDVVVGNPPYNKGMDLDFIDIGYKLSNTVTSMIVPAKWQLTADDYTGCASKNIDYYNFREEYTKHMKHICFYPDSTEVFNARVRGGITHFILDKQEHKETVIENKSDKKPLFNSTAVRSIENREVLNNIGQEIVDYLGDYEKFRFDFFNKGRYEVWTTNMITDGYYTLEGNVLVLAPSRIIDTLSNEKSNVDMSECTFSSDNRSECESFKSWLYCKFTRFFIFININKLGEILTDDYFRFVPAPPSGKFDHIYTDEELYKDFNLPQKYIDIIETVIKERK